MFVLIAELMVDGCEESRAFGPFPSIIAAQIFERRELAVFVGELIAGTHIMSMYNPGSPLIVSAAMEAFQHYN